MKTKAMLRAVRFVGLTALSVLGFAAACPAAQAQSRQLSGQAGYLGEFELAATLTSDNVKATSFSGPLTMKHVGICTQDGPEEKRGEIRLQLTNAASRMKASLRIDGVACSFTSTKADGFSGTLSCAGRGDVPVVMWLK
jgi:hypothetical protein